MFMPKRTYLLVNMYFPLHNVMTTIYYFCNNSITHDLHKLSGRHDIDVATFCEFIKSHHAFLFPAFEMQMRLQDGTLGSFVIKLLDYFIFSNAANIYAFYLYAFCVC